MDDCTCATSRDSVTDGPNVDCPNHGIGNIGGCIYCWSSGVIDDYDGERLCSACDGTGTPREVQRRTDQPSFAPSGESA